MGGWVCGCVCVCLKQVYNKLHPHWHCWKHLCLWQLNNFSTTLFIYIYLTFPRKVECWLANICILVTNGWLSVHIQLFFGGQNPRRSPLSTKQTNKTKNTKNQRNKQWETADGFPLLYPIANAIYIADNYTKWKLTYN